MPYLLKPKHKYPSGTLVEIVNDSHYPVMIVSKDGDLFSVNVDGLGEEWVPEPEIYIELPVDLFNQPVK